MKGTFAVLCLTAALGLATGAAAQDPSSSGTETKKAGAAKQHTMTLTGCLREATGTPGEYLLTDVTAPSGKEPATTGAASAESAASTYRLVGGGTVNLKEHVGHKVQVTGRMAGESHGTTGTEPSSSASSGAKEEKINVISLKHISASCEAGTTR